MRILAVSGSLRAQSSNTSLLRAMAMVVAPRMEVTVFEDIGLIPPFNPDLEFSIASPALDRFRQLLRASDAVVFSTPEYAHGMPGMLKNALDWVVGSGELSRKPVALVNASPRGVFAQASLKEVVQTMDARLITEAEVTVNLVGMKLTAGEIAGNPEFAGQLRTALEKLCQSIPLVQ